MVIGLIALPGTATEPEGIAPADGVTGPDLRNEMAGAAPLYAVPDWDDIVSVIVELASPTTVDLGLVDMTLPADSELGQALNEQAAAHRLEMLEEQNEVQAQIAALYADALFRYSYTNLINGFAARIPLGLIEAVQEIDGVLAVHISQETALPLNALEEDPYSGQFGWVEEEFELTFIDLNDMDKDEYLALMDELDIPTELPEFAGIMPLSDNQSWDVMGAHEAWDLGFTGAGRVAAVLDTMVLDTHMIFSYMDPVVAAEEPAGFISRDGIMQTVYDNQDTLNFFTYGWDSWFHWRDPAEVGFYDPGVRQRLLEGAFWRSDKVPFNMSYFYGTYEMTVPAHNHGTHVAGSILGNPGPNMINGHLGLAHDAQLLGVSTYGAHATRTATGQLGSDPNLQETDEGAFAAIEDAITLGTHSFNMSFGSNHGFSTQHQVLARSGYQAALNRAQELGIVTTISAGNSNRTSQQNTLVGTRTANFPNHGAIGFPSSLFAPMSVAAAIASGSTRISFNLTNMQFETATGAPVIESVVNLDHTYRNPPLEVRDNNPIVFGIQFQDEEFAVVDIGFGTAAEITAAGPLTGRVALITVSDDLIGAQQRAAAAGAVAAVIANDEDRIVVLTPAATGATDDIHRGQVAIHVDNRIYDMSKLPVLGLFRSSHADAIRTALAAGPVTVSFGSRTATHPPSGTTAFQDNGPATFTSWGITDALRLTPDIMAPGVNVYSGSLNSQNPLGAPNGNALFTTMSGTSMSSPNANGGLLLIQQSVIERIESGVFGHIENGTIEFSELVNQLAGSTATVYEVNPSVNNSNPGRYFSPRRQGSGMLHVGRAVQSNVVLHSGIDYNPFTGESQRNKVELFDNLGDQFEFEFVLDNFNDAPRSFDVSAVLQTDQYVTPAPGAPAGSDRPGLPLGNTSTGGEIMPLPDAIMTVANVNGDAVIAGTPAANINRYAENIGTTRVVVPANSSTVVTIAVDARGVDFERLDAIFTNGMFLEGFIWFTAAGATPDFESVNIPFLGFRGCWLSIPVFDFANIYDDIDGLTPNDLEHPMYRKAAIHTTVPGAVERVTEGVDYRYTYVPREVVAGVNQFTGTDWGGYALFHRAATGANARPGAVGGPTMGQTTTHGNNRFLAARAYFNTMRTGGHIQGDFIAFSPDGDGYADMIYANLNLLRNVKAAAVVIRDADGEIVNILGPEYDLMQILSGYDHGHRHWIPLHGGRFHRDAGWDGTDFDGNIVPDGLYTYEIRAMVEFEFLALLDEVQADLTTNTVGAYMVPEDVLIDALLNSPTVQYTYFPVWVDVAEPFMEVGPLRHNTLRVTATDPGGIQALGVFHDGDLVDMVLVNAASITHTFDLNAVVGLNPANIVVQAVDFALNLASVGVAETNYVTATFLWNDEQEEEVFATINVLTGETLTAPAAPVRAGYTFIHWTLDTGVDTPFDFTTGLTENVRLYAVWTAVPVDTTDLEAAIADARELDEADYTPESWAALVTARDAAEYALETATNQGAIDAATAALQAAIDALVSRDPVDTTDLETAIADARELDEADYTPESWAALVTARDAAEDALETATNQGAIDAATAALQAAMDALVNREPVDPEPEFHPAYMFGNERGYFMPTAQITRAQVATILARTQLLDFEQGVQRLPEGMDSFDAFEDVAPNNWFYFYVAWAFDAELVEGYRGRFRPNDPVTRQELAAMLARTIVDEVEIGETTFPDRGDIGSWATDYVYMVFDAGWMVGDTAGNFRPRANIMRAEVATAVNRMLERVDSRGVLDVLDEADAVNKTNARIFPDVTQANWFFAPVLGAANDHYLRRDDDGVISWKYVHIQQ